MSEVLSDLEATVQTLLARETSPTPERIRQRIAALRVVFDVTDDEAEHLAREFEARHGVTMTIGALLKDQTYEPWLDNAKTQIDPYYWNRYRKLLGEKHFSGQVIATIDEVTDRILGHLENPAKDGPWDRRGLVVGHVQSGKTANYTGLICKAADAGYKLIVVIAGIHNNLRNQTQLRIDEGFVGRDSARLLSQKDDQFIGVGRIDRTRRPATFTNSVKDFNKAAATALGIPLQNLKEPAVLVIKKNSSTLKHLLEWLREHSLRGGGTTIGEPMLLIDDEADNASINIRHGKGEVSRINGQIRDLLKVFDRSCYVGYTATPFANIFIDPETDHEMLGDDLFPRDFIISLDPPTNYFGADKVFLDPLASVVRNIDDNEDLLPIRHQISLEVTSLPPSLITAIRAYVLARAIRLARGHDREHSSMLVNVSRFTGVQRRVRNEIHNRLGLIQASARINGALPFERALRDPELAALHAVWKSEFFGTEFDWPIVQEKLHEAAAPIKVLEVNSSSPGALNYSDHEKNGLNVIAVGGYSLSRGLTLEGLTTSYFLRNSAMYDTLMQMGRWFGYRDGYEDLCRIWLPEEAAGWYEHIAGSIEELREELRAMEAANATPKEFGLKVRSHPDVLTVTARNKMGTGEKVIVSIGLGNSFIETAILKNDETSLEMNRLAARRLAERLALVGHPTAGAEPVSNGWLLRDVPVEPVLEFLGEFQNHLGSMHTSPDPVRRYIRERQHSELNRWDILIPGVGRVDEHALIDDSLGVRISCQRRKAGKRRSGDRALFITDKQRVASRGIERVGLSDQMVERARSAFRNDPSNAAKLKESGREPNYPDWIYRRVRPRPLLILHLLAIGGEGEDLSSKKPVVAWSISFPSTQTPEKRVEYVVGTVWLRENFRDEADEDEMQGDDD